MGGVARSVDSDRDPLALLWRWFAVEQCHGYSPLYERISNAVADNPEVLALVRQTPPEAHLPPNLLAAVHDLLLDGLDHPLAAVYAGRSDTDPVPLFVDVCLSQRRAITELMATRRVQTNDCGRSALIGLGLTWVAEQLGAPLHLVDVGTSAGLNLLCDRYRLDYGDAGATGPVDSPVTVACQIVAGQAPIRPALPALASRTGIDHTPIDVRQPDDARWLLACVWPDTGRLERIAASIELARSDPPTLVAGDAVEELPSVLARVEGSAGDGTTVVTTTWSFSYLPVEDRARFVELLADRSRSAPLAWLLADDASVVDEHVGHAAGRPFATGDHALGAVLFESGRARPALLATVQQHGGWVDWQAV